MLIEANGNLLQQISVEEEILKTKEEKEKKNLINIWGFW